MRYSCGVLAIADPPLENAGCGRRPRKAEIRPLGEPEVTRLRQKTTPQSATPKKDRKNRKETREKKGRKDGKERDGKDKKHKKIVTASEARQSRKKVK